jgi:phage terminase large subunit
MAFRVKKINIFYKPHERQEAFHNSVAKFRAFVGGIGSGKTMAGSKEMIKHIIDNPGSLNVIAAPTYPMLRDATLRTFFNICPKSLILDYNASENIIKFINGSEILCRSCEDPRTIDRLRGTNLSAFWIDEAAMVPRMAWKVLIGRLRQSPFKLKGWITTSPRGFNWVYEEFVEKKDKNYELIKCSSKENPYLTPEYIEDLVSSYKGVFARQEIEGEFVGFEGAVYPNFDRRVHIRDIKKEQLKRYVAGVDWGFTNPAVILVMGLDFDNRYHVVREFYQTKVMNDTLVSVALQLQKEYNIEIFYCDPSSPQLIQQFQIEGLMAVKGDNEIIAGISTVASKLALKQNKEPSLFVDNTCINTIDEFQNYRYPEGKEEKPIQENPIKLYDHAMDALRYAIVGNESSAFDYSPTIA